MFVGRARAEWIILRFDKRRLIKNRENNEIIKDKKWKRLKTKQKMIQNISLLQNK